jgi:glycine hydroxymethyltransferase
MQTGFIDYERLEQNAKLFRPKLIICGASAYPQEWDYKRLRAISDQHGAYLMSDVHSTYTDGTHLWSCCRL